MKCYYHATDADGWCCARQIWEQFGDGEFVTKDDFIGMDYTKPIDFSNVCRDEVVFILDYACSVEGDREAIKNLYKNVTRNITWIDHHEDSLIFDKENPDCNIYGYRVINDKYSAAMLLWIELNMNNVSKEDLERGLVDTIAAPPAIQYISDHDTFSHKLVDTLNFQAALKYYLDLGNYNILTTDDMDVISGVVSTGKLFRRRDEMDNRSYAKSNAFLIEVDGHKVYAMNKRCNSLGFSDLYYEADAVLPYYFTGDQWRYSLFANLKNPNHLNCGDIARLLGGGGREGAAGFSSKELLIKKNENGYYLDLSK